MGSWDGDTKVVVKSSCGVARLLSAVFGVDERQAQQALGLRPVRLCVICNGPIDANSDSPWCSKECRHAWHWIKVECQECHQLKEVRVSRITRKRHYEHFFCSRKCLGVWLARTEGFGVHPEHMGHRKFLYDYDFVWQERLATGMGSRRLSRILNMPEGSIEYILGVMRRKAKEALHG